uniref:Uncharacterized protein n=1 Tax=Cucumis melo TaxID=3656 RepID=A0A9I9ELM2_CUCME
MDGATSSTRIRDCDGGDWVRGDTMTAVGASRTNTGWSRYSLLASDPNVAM